MNRRDREELRRLVFVLRRFKAGWVKDSESPRVDPNSYHCGYCTGRADSYGFVISELQRRFPEKEVK